MMTFPRAIGLIGLVFLVNFIAIFGGFYEMWHWFDVPMHFSGGFAAGAFAYALWNSAVDQITFKGWFAKHVRWWFVPLFMVAFVALIGVGWEWYEFLLDHFFASDFLRQPGLADTMMDLFLDVVGGTVAALVFYVSKKQR